MLVANRKNGKIIYSKHLPKTGVPTVKTVARLSLIALLLTGFAAPASAAPAANPVQQDDSESTFGRPVYYWCVFGMPAPTCDRERSWFFKK